MQGTQLYNEQMIRPTLEGKKELLTNPYHTFCKNVDAIKAIDERHVPYEQVHNSSI